MESTIFFHLSFGKSEKKKKRKLMIVWIKLPEKKKNKKQATSLFF